MPCQQQDFSPNVTLLTGFCSPSPSRGEAVDDLESLSVSTSKTPVGPLMMESNRISGVLNTQSGRSDVKTAAANESRHGSCHEIRKWPRAAAAAAITTMTGPARKNSCDEWSQKRFRILCGLRKRLVEQCQEHKSLYDVSRELDHNCISYVTSLLSFWYKTLFGDQVEQLGPHAGRVWTLASPTSRVV